MPQTINIPQNQYTAVVKDGVVNAEGIGNTINADKVEVSAQRAMIIYSNE